MLFAVGTKVRFKNTGDEGVITAILDMDMVHVLLDDGDMEIPAFIENLERMEDIPRPHQKPVKAKFIESKKPPKPLVAPSTPLDSQYFILKSLGIQLAFEPKVQADGTTGHYQIILINDTRYDALFTFTFDLKGTTPRTMNGKIESVSYVHLGEMRFSELNEAPKINLDIWQLTTVGTGYKLSKSLKIKPKQFFKNVRTVPLLDKEMHWYQMFENFDKEEKTDEEDLKSYTQKNARKPKSVLTNYQKFSGAHPNELAAFVNELDLHIENLLDTPRKLNNAEILRIQLTHFDAFLEKALKVGVDRIFVIHGLGKGKLRNEIATRLINHPHVKTFKNEYHPRYGFGATEVLL